MDKNLLSSQALFNLASMIFGGQPTWEPPVATDSLWAAVARHMVAAAFVKILKLRPRGSPIQSVFSANGAGAYPATVGTYTTLKVELKTSPDEIQVKRFR
jgi:hypothetical protein